jgi:hypothetical protein
MLRNKAGTIIAVVLSAALLALNTYTKDYDLGELAQKHVETATRLWSVRESYLSLLADLSDGNVGLDEAIVNEMNCKRALRLYI